MHILVKRFLQYNGATLSAVSIDGVPECWFLEDGHNDVKVHGQTRIPAGTYSLGVRTVGGFHKRYSGKFPSFHKGMIEVLDVPNYKYILIHIGNTAKDTMGCALTGSSPNIGRHLSVSASTQAYKKFYPKVIDAVIAGIATITYVDADA